MYIRKLKDIEILDNIDFLNEMIIHTDHKFIYSRPYIKDNWLFNDFNYINDFNENIKVIVGCMKFNGDEFLHKLTDNSLNNYLTKFNIHINNAMYVEFRENDFLTSDLMDRDSKQNSFIFKKMNTIMSIIKDSSKTLNCDYLIFKPGENDTNKIKKRQDLINRRELLYTQYLDYFKYEYRYIFDEYYIKNVLFSNKLERFYVVKMY